MTCSIKFNVGECVGYIDGDHVMQLFTMLVWTLSIYMINIAINNNLWATVMKENWFNVLFNWFPPIGCLLNVQYPCKMVWVFVLIVIIIIDFIFIARINSNDIHIMKICKYISHWVITINNICIFVIRNGLQWNAKL